jgi:hypothetical protein
METYQVGTLIMVKKTTAVKPSCFFSLGISPRSTEYGQRIAKMNKEYGMGRYITNYDVLKCSHDNEQWYEHGPMMKKEKLRFELGTSKQPQHQDQDAIDESKKHKTLSWLLSELESVSLVDQDCDTEKRWDGREAISSNIASKLMLEKDPIATKREVCRRGAFGCIAILLARNVCDTDPEEPCVN